MGVVLEWEDGTTAKIEDVPVSGPAHVSDGVYRVEPTLEDLFPEPRDLALSCALAVRLCSVHASWRDVTVVCAALTQLRTDLRTGRAEVETEHAAVSRARLQRYQSDLDSRLAVLEERWRHSRRGAGSGSSSGVFGDGDPRAERLGRHARLAPEPARDPLLESCVAELMDASADALAAEEEDADIERDELLDLLDAEHESASAGMQEALDQFFRDEPHGPAAAALVDPRALIRLLAAANVLHLDPAVCAFADQAAALFDFVATRREWQCAYFAEHPELLAAVAARAPPELLDAECPVDRAAFEDSAAGPRGPAAGLDDSGLAMRAISRAAEAEGLGGPGAAGTLRGFAVSPSRAAAASTPGEWGRRGVAHGIAESLAERRRGGTGAAGALRVITRRVSAAEALLRRAVVEATRTACGTGADPARSAAGDDEEREMRALLEPPLIVDIHLRAAGSRLTGARARREAADRFIAEHRRRTRYSAGRSGTSPIKGARRSPVKSLADAGDPPLPRRGSPPAMTRPRSKLSWSDLEKEKRGRLKAEHEKTLDALRKQRAAVKLGAYRDDGSDPYGAGGGANSYDPLGRSSSGGGGGSVVARSGTGAAHGGSDDGDDGEGAGGGAGDDGDGGRAEEDAEARRARARDLARGALGGGAPSTNGATSAPQRIRSAPTRNARAAAAGAAPAAAASSGDAGHFRGDGEGRDAAGGAGGGGASQDPSAEPGAGSAATPAPSFGGTQLAPASDSGGAVDARTAAILARRARRQRGGSRGGAPRDPPTEPEVPRVEQIPAGADAVDDEAEEKVEAKVEEKEEEKEEEEVEEKVEEEVEEAVEEDETEGPSDDGDGDGAGSSSEDEDATGRWFVDDDDDDDEGEGGDGQELEVSDPSEDEDSADFGDAGVDDFGL